MMYKFIFFDLGGVLFTNGTQKFITILSERYKKSPEFVAEIVNGAKSALYREGKITRAQFWDYVLKNLDLKETREELEKEWFALYRPIPETKRLILKLRERYKVFYLTDNIPERVKYLDQKYGFLRWFDGGVFCFEIGARKPSPLIFKAALKKAKAKPEEVIFIDDKRKNVEAAARVGMTAILFETVTNLESELRKKGVGR